MKGIDKTRLYLGAYKGNYVIIVGIACNLNLEEANMVGRATKDIDMIMGYEAFTPEHLKVSGISLKLKDLLPGKSKRLKKLTEVFIDL